jgi:hypothetical protein
MQTGNGIATQNYRDKVPSNSSDPQLTTEIITPALAEEMLRHNTCNRPIKESNVTFLTNEILEGRWKLTGSAIQFVGNVLVDGQHRLKAVIASGKSIKAVIARFPATAAAKEIFKVIDVGASRTVGDILAINGEANVNVLAGVLKGMDRYYRAIEHADHSAQTIPFSSQTQSANKTLKTAQKIGRSTVKKPLSYIMDLLAQYPFARESAKFGVSMSKQKPQILTPTQWGLMHAILNDVDESDASKFLESLNTGENLSRQSPILQLRERLLSIRTDMGRDAQGIGPHFVLALCNAAWNAYRTGKPINPKKISAGDPIQIAK